MNGSIFCSQGKRIAVVIGPSIFDLNGQKLYDLKSTKIYKLRRTGRSHPFGRPQLR
jgi:hypothetical protein